MAIFFTELAVRHLEVLAPQHETRDLLRAIGRLHSDAVVSSSQPIAHDGAIDVYLLPLDHWRIILAITADKPDTIFVAGVGRRHSTSGTS